VRSYYTVYSLQRWTKYKGKHRKKACECLLWLQFTTFDTCVPTDDSFTELRSGAAKMLLPVLVPLPVSSPKSALVSQSTPRTRPRTSRVLSFDNDDAPSGRHCGPCPAARPSLTARRRSHRAPVSIDRLPRTSTAVNDDFTQPQPFSIGETTPEAVISGCIEEDEERADLIGDLTVKHALPLERNTKHADLKTISPQTVSCDSVHSNY